MDDDHLSDPAGTLDAARDAHVRDVVELAVERAMDKARREQGPLGSTLYVVDHGHQAPPADGLITGEG